MTALIWLLSNQAPITLAVAFFGLALAWRASARVRLLEQEMRELRHHRSALREHDARLEEHVNQTTSIKSELSALQKRVTGLPHEGPYR